MMINAMQMQIGGSYNFLTLLTLDVLKAGLNALLFNLLIILNYEMYY